METKTKKLLIYLIFPLLLANGLAVVGQAKLAPDYLLHANFYDVGQGDAIFIQTYLGRQILIDGGPTDQVLSNLGKDMPFYDRTIDLIILSHPHTDHVTGLIDVLKRYKVKKMLLSEVEYDAPAYKTLLELIAKKKIEKIYAQEGQRIYLDQATVFDVYSAGKGSSRDDKINETSVVGKLSFGQTRLLFTGDAGFETENKILPKYNLDSDLLKVGHQGSRYSTSKAFLAEVTPNFAVIEVGKNSYGHPTQEVLDNLKSANAYVLRTDEDGTVKFVSNGNYLYKR